MKTGFLVSTLVALVLAVVVVMGMGQISGLKKEMADLKKEVPAKSAKGRTAVGRGVLLWFLEFYKTFCLYRFGSRILQTIEHIFLCPQI